MLPMLPATECALPVERTLPMPDRTLSVPLRRSIGGGAACGAKQRLGSLLRRPLFRQTLRSASTCIGCSLGCQGEACKGGWQRVGRRGGGLAKGGQGRPFRLGVVL